MSSHVQNTRQPLYSPVPLETIESAIEQSTVSTAVIPTVVDALDELQLGLLKPSSLVPENVWVRSEKTTHLCVDEYPGVHGDPLSHLLFLTGEVAQKYFDDAIPSLSEFELAGVRLSLTRYAEHAGFNFMYDPMVTPIPMRTVSYDDLVTAEPGSFYPPLPQETARRTV